MALRVLITEDDYDLRTIVSDFLTASGYKTTMACDGEEAMARIKAQRPDLLILDLSLPKLDGWSVVRQLRALPETQTLPVIAFTAHAMAGDRAKAEAAGCNGFITKPFRPEDLLREIQRLLPSST